MDFKSNLISAASGIDSTCSAPATFSGAILIVVSCCILGLFWALHNYRLVKKIDVRQENSEDMGIMEVIKSQKDLLV
jgi:hypothetical protein